MEICAGCADIPDDEPDPDERRAVCFYPEYDAPDQRKGRRMYPHVSAGYGNDEEEAEKLLKGYLALGYRYFEENAGSSEDVERLVVLLDERYFYDETGYLRSGNRSVRRLFHRLNQAKEELAFVVKKNEAVYSVILGSLQAM